MTTGKKQTSWVTQCPSNDTKSAINSIIESSGIGGGSFIGGAVDSFVDYFTTPDGRFDSGYYMPKGSKLFMSGEVINYLKLEQKVFVRLDLEWVPGKQGTDAIKTALNVEGCDFQHTQFKKAGSKGKGTITSEEFTVKADGTVVCQRKFIS
jgi:hypothetical protein